MSARTLLKQRLSAVRIITATCCALAAVPLSAHPHVWINYASIAQMQGSELNAVREKWTFSEGFPVSIVGDLTDMPKSGPLGPKYTKIFKQQAFDSLKAANYFTHVFVDGKPANFGEALNFSVAIENGHVVYTFVLPLTGKVDLKRSAVQLGIWDDTFFVDFQAPSNNESALTFDSAAPKTCAAQPFEDRDHPIFGGAIFPRSTRLSC
jgi:ABC-type uncharacterized transport system substrate-binding protein